MTLEKEYYAAYGHLVRHLPGVFIVKASNLSSARQELDRVSFLHDAFDITGELQKAWSPGLDPMIDDIEGKRDDYYTRLGSNVYYFEI